MTRYASDVDKVEFYAAVALLLLLPSALFAADQHAAGPHCGSGKQTGTSIFSWAAVSLRRKTGYTASPSAGLNTYRVGRAAYMALAGLHCGAVRGTAAGAVVAHQQV